MTNIADNDPEDPPQQSMTPRAAAALADTTKKKRGMLEQVVATLNPCWEVFYVISCVIAVSVDPLFFYLPIIDQKNKCLGMDTTLKVVALVLRSATDVTYIVNIVYQICKAVKAAKASKAAMRAELEQKKKIEEQKAEIAKKKGANRKKTEQHISEIDRKKDINKKKTEEHSRRKGDTSTSLKSISFSRVLAQKLPWLNILIDVVAVLPIPQVLIVAAAAKMRSSKYLDRKKTLNFFLLAQYLPRVYRMHHSSVELRRKTNIWMKGAFNFFMYILASHVLGAFWYFFSIQRETSCWHKACILHSNTGCNLYCTDSRNMTFINSLDEFCLVDVPGNATAPFDYGIFLDSLKNGNAGSIDFRKKFLYSFWWGLRNLSNFGTNLETTTYVWENAFAILISVIGLLLFLYLIGKVQTFISLRTEKSEERDKKLKHMKLDIQVWMKEHKFNDEMKLEMKEHVKQNWEDIKDVNTENLLRILPVQTRKRFKEHILIRMLRNVPRLASMDVKGLKIICEYLQPISYSDHSFIFRSEEPVDRIFFIEKGYVLASPTGESNHTLEKRSMKSDDFYGDEELLTWIVSRADPCLSELPTSQHNIRCHSRVDCIVLLAKDLKTVVSRSRLYWELKDISSDREKEVVVVGQALVRRYRDGQQRRKAIARVPTVRDTSTP